MNRTVDDAWIVLRWRRIMISIGMGMVLLMGIGLGREGQAQSAPTDSQGGAPPGIERVQKRIEEIRRAPTYWRQRLGAQLSGGSPTQPAPVRTERSRRLTPLERRNGPTRADLRRVERRLQALIRQFLAEEYGGQVPAKVAERFRFVPTAVGDTVRVATPIRDTITVADTVRVPPDTIRETRVETVERRLLDTGVFRGFEVNFAFGKSTLQPRATRTLDAMGVVLQRYPDLRLEIGGHTDAVGTDAFNQRLSEARAEAVRSYLIDRFAIGANRLVARGYGESKPVASNQERSGRALNRRVEFRVLNPEAMP